MKLLANKKYFLVINSNGRKLGYLATIIEADENFVHFVDKFGKNCVYKTETIESMEEKE